MRKLVVLPTVLIATLACHFSQAEGEKNSTVAASDQSYQLRDAYYGDLHLHTTDSFDASIFGTLTTPDQAYKFARGEEISYQGSVVKRAWPLDFLAVTDHAENIGVFSGLKNPNSVIAKTELGQLILKDRDKGFWKVIDIFTAGKPTSGLDPSTAASTWQRVIATANRNYLPGKFTTFIGFEWTAQPNSDNLHRIVIFRGRTAPDPFTSWDSVRPEDLWTYLESARKGGNDAIAMPHNANASSGLMYPWNDSDGKPID